MTRELTVWISPFTNLADLDDAITRAASLATVGRAHGNLLLPTHFGVWPQALCMQSIPHDMLVAVPDDVVPIRERVEAAGLGFGAWGVPHTPDSGVLAAAFASRAGYYVANFEPDTFWLPGDDAAAVDAWWSAFWNAQTLASQGGLSGNVAATVVPNAWGLGAFKASLANLAAGCGTLALEVYEGLQTESAYHGSHLWPADGIAAVRATGVNANLVPILARLNLSTQAAQANRLGHGQAQVWSI